MGDPVLPTPIRVSNRRAGLLETLAGRPSPKSEVVEAIDQPAQTVYSALDELTDTVLLDYTADGYVTTQVGRLLVRRYRRLLGDDWTDEKLQLVARRLDVLVALADDPGHKRDLVDRLDVSRSTVYRAIERLDDAGWVCRRSAGFATTDAGRDAVDRYRSYRTDCDSILAAREALAALPYDCELPLAVVTTASVEHRHAGHRLVEVLSDRLEASTSYRALSSQFADSRHVRLLHDRVLQHGLDVELVAPATTLDAVREELPHVVTELASADGVAAYSADAPSFGLFLFEREDAGSGRETTVTVVTYDDGAAGLLVSDDERAVEWARSTYQARRDDARDATADLREAPASADLPRLLGGRLPARLRSQGFVRVDAAYVEGRDPLAPGTAWRAGLGLPEVAAGYAVARTRDGRSLTEELLERLRGNQAVALLGPPGSGKSTVCKRVACRWQEADEGVVLYRERERGEPFDATGTLEALIERCAEPVLVVVEDAVRPEASAVFEAVASLRGRDDVTFLLDARENEWSGFETVPMDARIEAVRQEYVETTYVPRVDESECRRLVDHVEAVTGEHVGIPPSGLLADAHQHSRDDAAAPGTMVLLMHRLARYVQPLAGDDAPTRLETAVDRVRTTLDDEGDIAGDVGALVALLIAAGVPVEPAYVHAIAADRTHASDTLDGVSPDDGTAAATHDAVWEALDRLEGRVVFETDGSGYRTVHETWAVTYLERLLTTEGERRATARVGRVANALLSLADEPTRRQAVGAVVDEPAVLERIAAAPEAWADEIVERLFGVGRTAANLAPIFGDADDEVVELPEACSPWTRLQRSYWKGQTNLAHGNLDRAERAFVRLGQLAETVDPGTSTTAPPTPEFIGDHGAGDDAAAVRTRWRATSRTMLGTVAGERGEFETAGDHYREALARFDDVGDRRGKAVCLNKLGGVAPYLPDADPAQEYFQRGLGIAEALDDGRIESQCLDNLGKAAGRRGDYDQAREYHERSLAIARSAGDRRQEAHVLNKLGVVARKRGEYDRAREHFERSLSLARDLGDSREVMHHLGNLGNVAYERGDYDRAREYYERSLDTARDLGNRLVEAMNCNNLGNVAYERGDYDRAREYHERSLAVVRDLGDRLGEARSLSNLGIVARERGRFDRAREYHERSLEVVRDLDDRAAEARVLDYLGELARRRGAYDEAGEYHERSLEVARDAGDRLREALSRANLGVVAGHRGNTERASEYLDEALETVETLGDEKSIPRIQLFRGEVALARDDTEGAREHAHAARETAENRGMTHLVGRSRLLVGRVETAADAPEPAREHLQAAHDTFETVGAPQDTLDTLSELVDLCRAQGDETRAQEWYRQARSVLEEAPDATAATRSDRIERHAIQLDV